ncbi:hypothetical protein ASPWEDRAFT_45263 [Aspergillus wentii DTO 134E9]|uniref:Zinc/cadmium resistance protein n=1 Tax=Aspergillus wentii DTO 134E9 TaxID=1073089 RepID=A0A1L9R8R4_ASPWE|nr:uncharacterized protein ASPWEDRAFT_45263 [Aspergillus wentii DTO 134E9]KAI9925124.1 hypothetical protein MW887_006532 [Aspergillus wentii]OJJ31310.1 hypothetical protein ASPWEDRAFT_45263 [Aspergillus wentii DTO 134E9]
MGLSKTQRIIILLVIDTAFFLLELTVGYAVHSLALVADSFHMLNDVLSLCVGLWAVQVANRETSSKMYTFGWQRAETLGALVNGVFLVALCMTIFLEAIQRFVEPQEVQNPKLVCIVGCFGLLSNILGLVLFHDHSHGHGHSHGHEQGEIEDVEQGHGHTHATEADRHSTVANAMPENLLRKSRSDGSAKHDDTYTDEPVSPYSRRRVRRYSTSTGRGYDVGEIGGHPATMRQEIIAAGSRNQYTSEPTSESESDQQDGGDFEPSERSGLLRHKDRASNYTDDDSTPTRLPATSPDDDIHKSHNHAQPKPKSHGGHNHDLNMRGVFLHVMGDALGNVGVIVSALVIWLTDYDWRFYVDPGISFLITIIILCSAIPLCKAASRILLQAAPQGMSVDHIKEDIETLPGVIGSHHLHVWQLSDTKIVASIHIQVDTDIKGEGSDRYMRLAKQVRRCLHAYGIHSSTIQPEFAPESDVEDNQTGPSSSQGGNDATAASSKLPSRAASVREDDPRACLLECGEECARGGQCCPTKSP